MVAQTCIGRGTMLLHRPLPMLQPVRPVPLFLDVLVPEVSPETATRPCIEVVECAPASSSSLWVAVRDDVCAAGDAERSGDDAAEEASAAKVKPDVLQEVAGEDVDAQVAVGWTTAEADGAEQRLVHQIAAAVRSSALAAMPFEAVDIAQGTEAYHRQHISMVEQLRGAFVQMPPEVGNELLEKAESMVEEIMSAAKDEKLEIGLSLQPRWLTLSAAERRPWEDQHQELIAEHERSLQTWREGTAIEPKRPSGAWFAWIRDAMQKEWERRRRPCAGT